MNGNIYIQQFASPVSSSCWRLQQQQPTLSCLAINAITGKHAGNHCYGSNPELTYLSAALDAQPL
jgi:hypothetical protein